jgi:glycosyltransferase involved in cell wall biosynthesis
MQIAIDYTPAGAQAAGIGRYARELIAALARADRANRYTLFSAREIEPGNPVVAALPLARNVDLRVVPVGERCLARVWHRLRLPLPAELLTGPAQIFHALDFTLPPTRMRRVVTIHDLAFLTHPQCAMPALAAYLRRAVPRAARAADMIITVSEHTRDVLLRWLPDLKPTRVVTIPLGVSARFAPCTDLARKRDLAARLGLAPPFVLAVGTLEPRKNYPNLIRAFAQARGMPGGPRQLVIAGRRGWREASIATTIDELELGDAVRIVETLDDADLAALYTLADVAAQVSYTEGFGLPVLEAMGCGAPVVISDGGALPEVAGDAAVCVPASDPAAIAHALHAVITDSALRHRLVARGRARAARFTWDATAARTLSVYAQVA